MIQDATESQRSDEVRAVSAEVRVAVSRAYRRFRSERTRGELGDAAIGVLAQLRKRGPQTLKSLSYLTRVTPGSMSQTVNRLTADGYATRVPDPTDRRKVLFEPTPKGLEVEASTMAQGVAWLDSEIAQLTDAEREVLKQATELLKRIAGS